MRTLELLKLVGGVSLLATAPVVSTVVIYGQLAQRGTLPSGGSGYVVSSPSEGPTPLAGQNVVTSDGARVGEIIAITSNDDGRIQQILFRTHGWLGFGKRLVAIPAGEYSVTGQDVFLNLNSTEISNLPGTALSRG